MTQSKVIRTPLLTAQLAEGKTVDRVEIQEIAFATDQQSPLHLHPCPVVGLVTEGQILFQIEGEASQVLHVGDAFFEPANVRVAHFDALNGPAKFVAYYLLGKEDGELIVIL